MSRPVILVTARMFGRLSDAPVRSLEAAGYAVRVAPHRARSLGEEEVRPLLDGVVAVIAGLEPWTDALMAAATGLRLICRFGVGHDTVDLAAASRRGILVGITSTANHTAAAEHTLALMLVLTRRVASQDAGAKRGEWAAQPGPELRGRTLGIVGLGRIGREVAGLARAFGMRIIAHEPAPDLHFVAAQGIGLVDLDTLLAQADVVSLHLPLTRQTRHLIDARALAIMRPGAYLINTARGGIVDEEALYPALASGHLGGAALDVTDPEPPVDWRLARLPHVVMTPHVAGLSTDAIARMEAAAVATTLAVLRGERPPTILDDAAATAGG